MVRFVKHVVLTVAALIALYRSMGTLSRLVRNRTTNLPCEVLLLMDRCLTESFMLRLTVCSMLQSRQVTDL